MPPKSEEAALAAAEKLLVEAEEETTPSGETEVTEEVEETVETTEHEFPSLDGELPEDLREELEEPEPVDFFGEAAQEIDEELDEYSDISDTERELLKRARAAEKKAAHYEELRLRDAKKNWVAEATKFFPLAEPFLDEINASSRRGYLRAAKAVHEKMKPIVEERVIKPAREAFEAERERVRSEAKEEARRAWGEATVEVPEVPSDPAGTQQRVETARRRGDLAGTLKAMMFPESKGE